MNVTRRGFFKTLAGVSALAAVAAMPVLTRATGLMAGTAPSPVSMSFWIKSTKAGVFSVQAGGGVAERYTIEEPNVWTKQTIVLIPGDTVPGMVWDDEG